VHESPEVAEGLYTVLACAAVGLAAAALLFRHVRALPAGEPQMRKVAEAIRAGSFAYLTKQYIRLSIFAASVFGLLLWAYGGLPAIAFLAGVATSAAAGFTGMLSATHANLRTAEAARMSDARRAFVTAFFGAAPLGLAIASLGLFGVCCTLLAAGLQPGGMVALWGFSLGASATALFARVGGGIYTKAADVGSDLVGKVEKGIPEDDPRNPGVIADNVGDNVGDVAGMGADLFESYVGSLIAAVTIAAAMGLRADTAYPSIAYPIVLALLGLGASLLGILSVPLYARLSGYRAVAAAEISAQVVFLASAAIATTRLGYDSILLVPVLVGASAGFLIGRVSTFYTSGRPVREIVRASRSGPATNVITGIAVGFESSAAPLVILAAAVIVAHWAAGVFGVALAGVAMLSTVGIMASIDSSGPIADNAGGIVEMSALGPETRAITDELDRLGNSTAANGKGFAIGSAVLTALGLFFAFQEAVAGSGAVLVLDITNPRVIAGAFVGAAVVAIAGALTLRAVGSAATSMVEEIRRQFREIPGLLDGEAEPETIRCVQISTDAALNRMIPPTLITLAAPVAVGFVLGAEALAGLLLGAMLVGAVVAILMANAGGAWDNAKKSVELGRVDGARKGDAIHAATVIGDTVGDPFKDTTGPSLNILIKLLSIVALMITPLIL